MNMISFHTSFLLSHLLYFLIFFFLVVLTDSKISKVKTFLAFVRMSDTRVTSVEYRAKVGVGIIIITLNIEISMKNIQILAI